MIEDLLESVRPFRERLIGHPIYRSIDTPAALRCFMGQHVFAVWDFMTLLKALQQNLTCVSVPWTPTPHREARRLINEIVLAEESDEDGEGSFASHFESYLDAMGHAGADVRPVTEFVAAIAGGLPVEEALRAVEIPAAARDFVMTTWGFVAGASLPAMVAAFTVGREDLIPDLFRGLVAQATRHDPAQYDAFLRYLDRHVHLDGDQHGPMALNLLRSICGDDEGRWEEAQAAAVAALEARRQLWDGVVDQIQGLTPAKS